MLQRLLVVVLFAGVFLFGTLGFDSDDPGRRMYCLILAFCCYAGALVITGTVWHPKEN